MMVVQSDPQKREMYVLESKRMKWAHTHTRTRTKTDTNASESATNAEIQEFGNCFPICCCDQKPLECDYGWKDDKHHFRIFFHFLHINYGSKFIKCDIHQWLSLYFQFFSLPFFALPSFPFSFSVVGWFCFACVSGTHKKNVAVCVFLLCVNRYLSRKLSKQKVAIPDPNHIANAYTFSICVFFSDA